MAIKLSSFARIVSLMLLTFSMSSYALVDFQLTDKEKEASTEILNQLKFNHYRYITIDDSFSSHLLDRFLDDLDPNKSYFLASDIKDFEKYRKQLDNALNQGNMEPAVIIYSRYQQHLENRLNWLLESIGNGLDSIDFSIDEDLVYDRTNADWANNAAELDDYWRKVLKNAVLSLKLTDKPLDEIAEVLTKRYDYQLSRLNQTRTEDVFELFINAVAQSYDPHTEYFAPQQSENFNINMSLSLEGIGAVLQSEDEYTKVARLVPGGPADMAGELQASDRIVGVAQGADGKMEDIIGWRLDDVVELIRGPKDSVVRLQVLPAGASADNTKVITIVRNKVLLEEQDASSQIIEIPHAGKTKKIGVIDVPAFYADFEAYQAGDPEYKSTTRDVRNLIVELEQEGIDGLIIDLRNNGGGSLNEANSLVGLFIKSGATVQIKDARGKLRVFSESDDDFVYDGPLAVLVNRLSASASEIFAGAIQDYQRGLIVGSQTFGKGTVQSVMPLTEGQLKITQAKFYRISGESTQYEGVVPDISFPSSISLEDIGESVLEDALPWDTIRPVLYRKAGSISPYISALSQMHNERIKTNPDFQYQLEQISKSRELREQISITLNETKRQEEQKAQEDWQLSVENKRRTLKNLPLISSLDELDTDSEESSDTGLATDASPANSIVEDNLAAEDGEETPNDPYMVETGEILLDYIQLSNQQLVSQQN